MKTEITLLYIIDDLRADHLSCYGYNRPTSENIDRLAEQAVIFENIYSQSTETKSSAATIYTSTYPSVHNTMAETDRLSTGTVTLAESMKLAGFVTAAFNANIRLGRDSGYDRGFDYYFDLHTRPEFQDITKLPPSMLITQEILAWLKDVGPEKAFITAWSMDTHLPYFPLDEFMAKFIPDVRNAPSGTVESIMRARKSSDFKLIVDLYDAEILNNDHSIGCLIRGLKEQRLWDGTTFIFGSDHGEMILEHGHFMDHGCPPYREVTHVPMLIKSPGLAPGRNSALSGLIDVMPTILKLAGAESPETIQGRDLFDASPKKYVFSEALSKAGGKAVAIFDTHWKLIRTYSPLRSILKKLFHRIYVKNNFEGIQTFDRKKRDKGIPSYLLIKQRLRKFMIDYIGNPPVFDINIFLWLKLLFKHFFGEVRLELYDLKNDPFEQKNVLSRSKDKTRDLVAQLGIFQNQNATFRDALNLRREQYSIDPIVAERLKHLGYLD